MRKYRLVAKKGEGTFSEVLKAQNVKDGRYHAIKCMKNRFESIDQVNNLREIQALRRLSPHEHIITLEEVLYDQPTGRLALVFELMDANLYELIKGRRHYLNPQLIKSYVWQLMKSLDHMHRKGIFHRDIKPENILIESSTEFGKGLKLADFGSCRGICSKQPYTEYISTRWYRAPECLLTDGYYGPEMDLWGAGCVMFEITSLYPLFPGSNEVDQINRIHKVLGTPSQDLIQKLKSRGASHISFDFPLDKGIGIAQLIPHAQPDAIDLMTKLLKYDASERITARETLRHPYFRDIREAESKKQNTVPSDATVATNRTGQIQQQQQQQQKQISQQVPPQPGQQKKPIEIVGNQKVNQNIAKALPNIQDLTTSFEGGGNIQQLKNMQQQQGYNNNPSVEIYQQQPLILKNSNNKGGNSGPQGSLPPIAGNAGHQPHQPQAKQDNDPKTIRTLQASNQQKRRKKYRLNFGQRAGQNTEQIMRAYGVPKNEGGTQYNNGKADQGVQPPQGQGLSYGGHPNRHYVQAKK